MSFVMVAFDKRFAKRYDVNDIVIVVYKDGKEITGHIENMSEDGFCFFVNFDQYIGLSQGDILTVQFFDRFRWGRLIEKDVVSVKCNVRHVRCDKERMHVGVSAVIGNYRDYFVHKEVLLAYVPSCGYCKTIDCENCEKYVEDTYQF